MIRFFAAQALKILTDADDIVVRPVLLRVRVCRPPYTPQRLKIAERFRGTSVAASD